MIVCDHSEYHCNVEYNNHKTSLCGTHTLIEIIIFCMFLVIYIIEGVPVQ